jgi:ABC-type transporter Mla subunit MlaD
MTDPISVDDARPPHASDERGLEEFLAEAVDRQLSAERALEGTLAQLRGSVASLAERLEASGTLPDDVSDTLEEVRSGVAKLGELPEVVAQLSGGIRERILAVEQRLETIPAGLFQGVKEALLPQFEGGELRELLDRVERSTEAQSGDVQALARSMLDLNAGLREWADRIETRIASLAQSLLEGVRDLAQSQGEALGSLGDAVTGAAAELNQDVGGLVRETARSLGSRLDDVHSQLTEGAALSRYLQDQVDDLDKVLNQLGTVPDRLEGAVSQALRRALTVRAGLTREAEKALERTVGPVEENLERLVASLETVTEGFEDGRIADDVRKVSLRQVELTSRLEEMQEAVFARLEEIAEDARRRDEILAGAIDRAASGLAPEAMEELEAEPPPPKRTPPKRSAEPKRTAAPKRKAKAKRKAEPPAAKRAPIRRSPSAKKRPSADHTEEIPVATRSGSRTSAAGRSSRKPASSKRTSPKKKSAAGKRAEAKPSSKKKAAKKNSRSTSRARKTSGRGRGRSSRSADYIPV